MLTSLKAQAKQLKQQTLTVYFAARDPRMPLLVRALAVFVLHMPSVPLTSFQISFRSSATLMIYCWFRLV